MAEETNQIIVLPVEIKSYSNEYSEKFKTGMFVETIKVDPLTCVYRRWDSTRYEIDSMPTAHIFE